MAERKLACQPLISHQFEIANALRAYETVTLGKALGVILKYDSSGDTAANTPQLTSVAHRITVRVPTPATVSQVVIGVIGAGNFTGQVLLPALKKTGARLRAIASASGLNAAHLGRKFGFEVATSDAGTIFDDSAINTVVITTRHDTHARYVLQGLRAGKRVYVEKPLCIRREELSEIVRQWQEQTEPVSSTAKAEQFLMVGFNRRFAPHVVRLKSLLDGVKESKIFVMTVNAGKLASQHWAQDPLQGGGRIIGEACHFVDLLRFLSGAKITGVQARQVGVKEAAYASDCVSFTLSFADGSLGTIHYFANGHKSFPKERLEVFCAGRVLQLDNFRKLTGFGWPGFRKMNLWKQDKGHEAEMQSFVTSIRNGNSAPIPFGEIVEVAEATFAAAESV